MKVSIITVSYNSQKTINDTFRSVRNQNYNNIEYIVVDGNSSDNTLKIIKQNSDIIDKWISQPDKGIYDAMNKGIELSTGELIGILNSDDFYYNNNVISKVVNEFKYHNIDSLYSDLIYVKPTKTKFIQRYWKSKNFKENSFLFGWMPAHPTFFVKKHVYETHGKFNLDLMSSADYEFMLRVLYKKKITTRYVNFISVVMRNGGKSNNSLLSRLTGHKEDILAWSINGIKPYFFTLFLKPLRKIPQFFIRPKYKI